MAIKNLLPWNRDTKINTLRKYPEEEPLNALLNMQNELDQMFESFFERPFGRESRTDFPFSFSPSVDVAETDKEITVTADLPGLKADEVEISLENRVLTIRGEKNFEKEDEGHHFHRKERSYGAFQRDVVLPADVKEDQIEAVFKNGVLEITAPKAEITSRKRIKINKS